MAVVTKLKKLFYLSYFLTAVPVLAEPQYYQNINSPEASSFFYRPIRVAREDLHFELNPHNIQQELHKKNIYLTENDKFCLNANFTQEKFVLGDRISINADEIILANINRGKDCSTKHSSTTLEDVVPCVVERKAGPSYDKIFALCNYNSLRKLPQYKPKTIPQQTLLNYSTDPNLTILYIILPKDRLTSGFLQIKDKGKFLRSNNGKILKFPIMGLSVLAFPDANYRIRLFGNTPQGIYNLYGWAQSPKLRGLPSKYLHISRDVPFTSNDQGDFVIDKIIPPAFKNEYWLNEYSLSAAFGRNSILIHDNTNHESTESIEDFNTGKHFTMTQGCLNLHSNTSVLLNLLKKHGILEDGFYTRVTSTGYVTHYSKVKKPGYVFVVVKDY